MEATILEMRIIKLFSNHILQCFMCIYSNQVIHNEITSSRILCASIHVCAGLQLSLFYAHFLPLMDQFLNAFRLQDYYKKAEKLCKMLLPVGFGTLFSRLLHEVRVVKSYNIHNGFKGPWDSFPSTYSLLSS